MNQKELTIPGKFYVAGIPVRVVFDPEMSERDGEIGCSDFQKQEITLCDKLSREGMDQAFLHEVLHFCLYAMGESHLNDDERFVDGLAHMIHQALTMQDSDVLLVDDVLDERKLTPWRV